MRNILCICYVRPCIPIRGVSFDCDLCEAALFNTNCKWERVCRPILFSHFLAHSPLWCFTLVPLQYSDVRHVNERRIFPSIPSSCALLSGPCCRENITLVTGLPKHMPRSFESVAAIPSRDWLCTSVETQSVSSSKICIIRDSGLGGSVYDFACRNSIQEPSLLFWHCVMHCLGHDCAFWLVHTSYRMSNHKLHRRNWHLGHGY